MAAPDMVAPDYGQINQAGDARAIFLKKYSGEVLRQYLDKAQMEPLTWKKPVKGQKSAAWPLTSTVKGDYHSAKGAYLTGNTYNNAEKIIDVDDNFVLPLFFNKIDDLMAHWDNRAPYVESMANDLVLIKDDHIMIESILGARSGALVTGSNGGTQILNDKFKLDAGDPAASATIAEQVQAFIDGLSTAAAEMTKKNVPLDGRFCVVPTDLYYALSNAIFANGFSLLNKDYRGTGANMATNAVNPIHGFQIIMSNHVPQQNITAAFDGNRYLYHNGDFRQTAAFCGRKGAVGCLEMQGIKIGSDGYEEKLQGELLVASAINGVGFVRPESLVELKLNTIVDILA